MDANATNKDKDLIHPELSYTICGLCFETHNSLGRFMNEQIYADFLEALFKRENIKYEREKALDPLFPGEKNRRNIPDFIIEDSIILDLKAKRIITKEDYFQMKRYLSSAKKKLGIIVNFRQKYIAPKRVLHQ